jgi:hypothetical protein
MEFQLKRADEETLPQVDINTECFENGPWVQFKNFTKDSKGLVCNVFEEKDGNGVLIYIPSVTLSDVFTKLVAGGDGAVYFSAG